jgi:hypothetical protein
MIKANTIHFVYLVFNAISIACFIRERLWAGS